MVLESVRAACVAVVAATLVGVSAVTCDRQLPATERCQCAVVSNDHSLALAEWLEVAAEQRYGSKLAVLHIDAHNDLNVPIDFTVFDDNDELNWLLNATRRHAIAESVDLANFQLAAVWAGLVDRIIWIRQGRGNDVHTVSTLKLDRDTGSFAQSVPIDFAPWEMPEDHGVDVGDKADAANNRKLFYFHEIPEERLDDPHVITMVANILSAQPFILDIDLDFFVDDFGKPDVVQQLWKPCTQDPDETNAFPRRFPFANCSTLLRQCRHWMDPKCAVWRELDQMLDSINTADGASSIDMVHACTASFAEWWAQVKQHWQLQQQPADMHASEWMLVVDQLYDRRSRLESSGVKMQMDRLGVLLDNLGPRPPEVVTIARSVGGFTRIVDAPFLEERALSMVQSVWGTSASKNETCSDRVASTHDKHGVLPPCVRYAFGTASKNTLWQYLDSHTTSVPQWLRPSDSAFGTASAGTAKPSPDAHFF